jgi:CRP-like cAMP-binding protein
MNSTAPTADRLAQLTLFASFSPDEVRQFAEIAVLREFQPDEVVLHQGRKSQNLWIVLEGRCEVVLDSPNGDEAIVLAELDHGDHFGEMSFFHAAPHSANVRAKTPVKLLRITRTDYDKLVQCDSSAAFKLAYNTVESLASRLRRMDDWVAELLLADDGRPEPEWNRLRENVFSGWSL